MTLKYNIMSYLIGEGLRNVFKNKKSTFASITTMCLTMLMFGAFFIIGENINHIVANISSQQGMQVYLNKKLTSDEIKEIGTYIRKIDGVNTVTYVSQEEAFNQYKEQWKEHTNIIEGMTEDYLRPSYTVTLTDLSLNQSVQAEINSLGANKVEEILSSNESISMLESIAKGLRIGIFVLLVALIIISVFIISNTIKLSVHARRKEISIMKYVGATNSFIRWPFAVEGIIIGVISALITVVLVGIIYTLIAAQAVQLDVLQNLKITLVSFNDMFEVIMLVYLAIGIGIGFFGSSISMKKYLEV